MYHITLDKLLDISELEPYIQNGKRRVISCGSRRALEKLRAYFSNNTNFVSSEYTELKIRSM